MQEREGVENSRNLMCPPINHKGQSFFFFFFLDMKHPGNGWRELVDVSSQREIATQKEKNWGLMICGILTLLVI